MANTIADIVELKKLIIGMREAFARGENVMTWARQQKIRPENTDMVILVAYDLQAGGFKNCGRAGARANPEVKARWCHQLAEILKPWCTNNSTLLEVGCGEAVTVLSSFLCKIFMSQFIKEWQPFRHFSQGG